MFTFCIWPLNCPSGQSARSMQSYSPQSSRTRLCENRFTGRPAWVRMNPTSLPVTSHLHWPPSLASRADVSDVRVSRPTSPTKTGDLERPWIKYVAVWRVRPAMIQTNKLLGHAYVTANKEHLKTRHVSQQFNINNKHIFEDSVTTS